MEVRELKDLCGWFETYGQPTVRQCQTLFKKLQHNATQPGKQPVREDLKQLLGDLNGMPMHLLTREQVAVLEREKVREYLGKEGALYIERMVKSARFDPASAANELQEIHTLLAGFQSKCTELRQLLSSIDLLEEEQSYIDEIAVRVHFREDAGINDITQLKEWSQEWYDIMRGIALCVDEPPESVKVLGAHQGSVILVLGTTVTATALLLLISNHLTKIALNALQLANAIEDFKLKAKLNKTVLQGLQKSIEDQEKDGTKELLDAAIASLPNPPDGEKTNALKKSIEKLQKFSKKGGEVDILPPPDSDEDEYDPPLSEKEIEDLRNVRATNDELRDTREETRLLTNQSDPEQDFEDEDLQEDEEGDVEN